MLIASAAQKMIEFYRGSCHDINHFLKVWAFAKTIGELEGLDSHTQTVLELTAENRSLEEVFLALTGETADVPEEPETEPKGE